MANAAIVILPGNESHADYGRLANALEAAREFTDNDDDKLKLILDGAGTLWVPELEDEGSDYHAVYRRGHRRSLGGLRLENRRRTSSKVFQQVTEFGHELSISYRPFVRSG